MMALGSAGGSGGSSLSSSNLSALAPPFSVDRSNSKSNSNPLSHFGDSTYPAPFTHTWNYPSHYMFSKPDVDVDSTRTTPTPLTGDYAYPVAESVNPSSGHWSEINPIDKSSTSAFYVAEAKPYYPAHVTSENSPLVPLNESSYHSFCSAGLVDISSQVDYTESLSGLEYTQAMPQWGGVWDGSAEVNRGKQIETGGCFFSEKVKDGAPLVYKNYMNQDPAPERNEDARILFGKSIDGIQRECHTGYFPVRNFDDKSLSQKLDSGISYGRSADGIVNESSTGSFSTMNVDHELLYSQKLGVVPFESSVPQFLASSSPFQESCPQGLLQESYDNFHNYQKTRETCTGAFDSFVQDSAFFKPSHAVVIRSPAKGTSSSARDPMPHKNVGTLNVANACNRFLDSHNPSNAKETHHVLPTPESLNLSKQAAAKEGHHCIFPASSSMRTLPSKQQYEDLIDPSLNRRAASQVTDTNFSSGLSLSLDLAQAFNYPENPSDFLDNHNPGVDSPCWKGAPASNPSRIDVDKAFCPNHFLKKLDGCYILDVPGNSTAPIVNDSLGTDSQTFSEGNTHKKTGCAENDNSPSLNYTSDSISQTKMQGSTDSVKVFPNLSNSEVGNYPNELEKSRRGCDLLSNASGYGTKYSYCNPSYVEGDSSPPVKINLYAGIEDGSLNCNGALEGRSVAYHAAENVLCSPSAQEDTDGDHQPSGRAATPKMDVPTLINVIHNLSELLHFTCSADSLGLNEQQQEVLKSVISNLDSCMFNKTVNSTQVPEPMCSVQDTSGKIGESCDLNKGKCVDEPLQAYQSKAKTNYGVSGNCPGTGKKATYSPSFPPLRDSVSISGDDEDMVQAIKKILDENFTFEEEMQSQSLLLKNLWLEAEAKLCTISCRARFDRMRFQMDGFKSNSEKDIEAHGRKLSGSNDSPISQETSMAASLAEDGLVPEGATANPSTFFSDTHDDGVEASVLARFNMLRCRDEKLNSDEQQQGDVVSIRNPEGRFGSSAGGFDPEGHADDVEASVMARFDILKCREDKSNAEQVPNMVHTAKDEGQFGSSVGGSGYESVEEFCLSISKDPVIEPVRNGKFGSQLTSGWYDNSSSDWEHVVKDDLQCQK